ncbi:unnamed protein product, partial [Brenthis ino]
MNDNLTILRRRRAKLGRQGTKLFFFFFSLPISQSLGVARSTSSVLLIGFGKKYSKKHFLILSLALFAAILVCRASLFLLKLSGEQLSESPTCSWEEQCVANSALPELSQSLTMTSLSPCSETTSWWRAVDECEHMRSPVENNIYPPPLTMHDSMLKVASLSIFKKTDDILF